MQNQMELTTELVNSAVKFGVSAIAEIAKQSLAAKPNMSLQEFMQVMNTYAQSQTLTNPK